jgi:hypothetical protein
MDMNVQRHALGRRSRLRECPHEPGEVFQIDDLEDALTD